MHPEDDPNGAADRAPEQDRLDREQSMADLDQAIGDREQLVADLEQAALDGEQAALDAARAGTANDDFTSSVRHIHTQGELARSQERRDAYQRQLDGAQSERDVRTDLFDRMQGDLDDPGAAASTPSEADLAAAADGRERAAQERADAAVRRAEAALERAREAKRRADAAARRRRPD